MIGRGAEKKGGGRKGEKKEGGEEENRGRNQSQSRTDKHVGSVRNKNNTRASNSESEAKMGSGGIGEEGGGSPSSETNSQVGSSKQRGETSGRRGGAEEEAVGEAERGGQVDSAQPRRGRACQEVDASYCEHHDHSHPKEDEREW